MVPQWPKVCPAPLTPSAAQGLKTLTFSSSHPALTLEAEQAKHKEEDWFSVFQLPDHYLVYPICFLQVPIRPFPILSAVQWAPDHASKL